MSHTLSRCGSGSICHTTTRRQLADDCVVLSGRRAGQPADLEFSAVAQFHHVETVAVYIENRQPGRKRLGESSVGCGPHRLVELSATEIVRDRHIWIIHTGLLDPGDDAPGGCPAKPRPLPLVAKRQLYLFHRRSGQFALNSVTLTTRLFIGSG